MNASGSDNIFQVTWPTCGRLHCSYLRINAVEQAQESSGRSPVRCSPQSPAKTQPGLREMITLKHPSTLGLSAEGLAKTIMVILLVVLVARLVAIWNRSQYRRREDTAPM